MKKAKSSAAIVRLTVAIPPDLAALASEEARLNHCGNVSAFFRNLLQNVRKSNARKIATP